MGQPDEFAAETQDVAGEQLQELRTANVHLKEIRKWTAFLGWVVLLYLMLDVVKYIIELLNQHQKMKGLPPIM